MKEILKHLITFFLELCAIGIYLDSGLDSLLAKLNAQELEYEATKLIVAYNQTLQQELLQSIIAVLSFALILAIHHDKVTMTIAKSWFSISDLYAKTKNFFLKKTTKN